MPRTRLQYSIRDLLWIMAGCAVLSLVLAQADRHPWVVLLLAAAFFVSFFVLLILRSSCRREPAKAGTFAWIPPPSGLNRENYVTGKTGYDSATLAKVRSSSTELCIAPDAWAWWKVLVLFAVAAAALFGISLMLQQINMTQFNRTLAVVVVGSVWFAGLVAVAVWSRRQHLQGPWLIYDKESRRLKLPRHGQEFELAEVVYLQYVTTENPDRPEPVEHSSFSELNLVTERDGQRQRWHLLRSDSTFRPFDRLLSKVLKHTPIPVVRIQGHPYDWDVTIAPYDG